MSHERRSGMNVFNCDGAGCNKNYDGDGSFVEVWNEAKADGWVSAPMYPEGWEHYCPTCKKELGDD